MDKNHKHLVLNATVSKPITDEEVCKAWLVKLVSIIDMKILIPPVARFCDTPGNEGVTGTVVIETSHASIHIWHKAEKPYIKMDVYSCKDFDPQAVVAHIKKTMGDCEGGYMIIDRNSALPALIDKATF